MTNSERRYMSKAASIPCVLCGSMPVELHHVREGQGMSQRASNFLVVALCPECHRGRVGLHGDRSLLRIKKLEELDLLAMTIAAVHE